MKFQPICDPQTAKKAAKRIFEKYRAGSTVNENGISSMMKDTYFNIQKGYKPNLDDINGYGQQLDANKDGKITLEDLESKAIKYLCGQFQLSYYGMQSPRKLERKFTDSVKKNLSVAKRLFEKYQDPVRKTIAENQVYDVIRETYEGIGRRDYEPSEDDIRVWMDLCDSNKDGKVVFDQYQRFVVRSLEKAGVTIYDE